MSTEPGANVGQLSPDGLWRWDGSQWVSTTPGLAPTPGPQRSRSWIWWLVGGCAVLLVIGLIGAGFGVYSLVTRFQHGAFSCLPSDFPNYPGTSVVSENTKVGGDLSPGDTNQCTMVLQSNDNVDAVVNFYQQNLANGDWTVVESQPDNGLFGFKRKSRPETVGSVSVSAKGQHTQIAIELDS